MDVRFAGPDVSFSIGVFDSAIPSPAAGRIQGSPQRTPRTQREAVRSSSASGMAWRECVAQCGWKGSEGDRYAQELCRNTGGAILALILAAE